MTIIPITLAMFGLKDLYTAILNPPDIEEYPLSNFWLNFAAGGLAGASVIAFMSPLGFIRNRLALDMGNNASKGMASTRQFKGSFDCGSKIYGHDGIKGLYRGCGIVVYRSLYFGLYEWSKDTLPEDACFETRWVAAMQTTATAGFVAYPLDTISKRL